MPPMHEEHRIQQTSREIHITANPADTQARKCRIIGWNIKYRRIRRMATECLARHNQATSERVLARLLKATFKQSLWHEWNDGLVKCDIGSPVRATDVAATREVLLSLVAAPTLETGRREPAKAAQDSSRTAKDTRGADGQRDHLWPQELKTAQPGEIITNIGEGYNSANSSKGPRIQCAIMNSFYSARGKGIAGGEADGSLAAPPTYPDFPNLPSTTYSFNVYGATDDEEYRTICQQI